MLEEEWAKAGTKRSISPRIDLVKELRSQLRIGLFEAKKLGYLLVDHKSEIEDQPNQVCMTSYVESKVTSQELEAMEEFNETR